MQEIKELIPPVYDENEKYEDSYGKADYKDKVILEIGSDVGSTASFFLSKGAKKVISVEGNPEFFERLVENSKRFNIIPYFKYIDSPENLKELIVMYKPNFLHMDCEYCEKHLLSLEPSFFTYINAIQLEIHCDRDLNMKLIDKFLCLGFDIYEFTLHRNVKVYFKGGEIYGDAWILLANRRENI